MRNSFAYLLTAAAIAFGFALGGPTAANAESVMRTCATEWKQAQAAGTTDGESWPQFLAQCRTRQGSAASPISSTAAPAPAPQSGSLFPWSQPSAPASNVAAPSGGQSVMRVCASQWKEAKAAGTTGGQSWPQFLSQCRASRSAAASPSGRFRSGSGACPSARSCHPVRLPVPMVATIGSRFDAGAERWRAFGPAGWPVYDRAGGPRPMSVGHRRLGQHADAHLPLLGNPLLRANPQGRVYVRS